MSLSDLTGLAGLTFTAASAACQRGTVKRCAGTAGVPPAPVAIQIKFKGVVQVSLSGIQRKRAGRPRSQQITRSFLCIRLRCALSSFVVIITVSYDY